MYTVLSSALGTVLPFEETKAGRDSQVPVISRARGAFPPPERHQITLSQIMADPSATHLRFKISVSSIDPCPPFRAKRKDQADFNDRLKID